MTEKRFVKICPKCGARTIYHAVRLHHYKCNKCKLIFTVPAIAEIENIRFRPVEREHRTRTVPTLYKIYAEKCYDAMLHDVNFSYTRMARELGVSATTVQNAVAYAKKQHAMAQANL